MAESTEHLRIVISAQDQASAVIKNVGSEMNSMVANTLKGAAAGVGFAAFNQAAQSIGQAFQFAQQAVVGFNSTLEQSRIAWTTMLGGAAQAETMLKQLQDFANETPFEFLDAERAARRFVAMGFAARDVIPLMTATAGAATALGAGTDGINRISLALGQMQTRTKVTAEDMMQLTEVGVPAWDILARATSQSVAQIQDAVGRGAVSADVMIRAFQQAAQERGWIDQLALNANTFTGILSTIHDTALTLLSSAFRPLFEGLKQLASAFKTALGSDDLKGFVTTVQNAQIAVGAFLSVVSQSEPILKTFGGALTGIAVVLGVVLIEAAAAAVAAFVAANAAVVALAAVAAVTGVVVAANWDDISQATADLAQNVGTALGALVDVVGQALNTLVTEWSTGWDRIGTLAAEALNGVGQVWNSFWATFGGGAEQAFQALVTLAADGWGKFAAIGTAALNAVLFAWNGFIGAITKLDEALPGALPDFLQPLVGKFVDAETASKGLQDALQGVGTTVGNVFTAVGTYYHDVVPTVIGRAIGMVQAAGGTLGDVIPRIQEILAKGLPGLTDAGSTAGKTLGAALGNGVVQGVKPLFEELQRLLAQFAAGPASAALEDAQAALKRTELVLGDLSQSPEARRQALQDQINLQLNVLPGLALQGFDANEAVRLAQRAENNANLQNNLAQTTLQLAQQRGGAPTAVAPSAVAPSGAVAVAAAAAAQPLAPTPITIPLQVVINHADGSQAVYQELIEANSQAEMPQTITVSAVR